MTNYNTITVVHVKKLNHTIEEIRLRALDNIISKFNLGFGCDCDAVKKELLVKLINWFSFEIVPCPEKVLDLLLKLIKTSGSSYLNAFGKLRFQNELQTLRKKIGGKWQEKLNEIEETVVNLKEDTLDSTLNVTKAPNGVNIYRNECIDSNDYQYRNDGPKMQEQFNSILPSTLDNSVPFDLTLQCGSGTIVSKKIEGGIKWLVMPWQPLVPSDKGVLSAVEDTLANTLETNLILHTCQFITNVMLQDFPAEVFLQRPSIVLVLHALLNSSDIDTNANLKDVILVVLKALHKLTRSLRFRIYYYCDPCVANRKQKELSRNLESNNYASSEDRDSPDGGLLEANYQVYQSAGTSDRSQSVIGNVDDSVLQLQQMLIPTYCVESFMRVISLLSLPDDPKRPLKINKQITDLSYELVQLLTLSVMPNIWLCNDGVALKLQEELKEMLKLLSEVVDYFGNYSSVDHCRITYLHLITIVTKLLSNIVPLELADVILPKELKLTICVACMDASIYLMYPSLHVLLQDYARQFCGNEEVECVKLLDETRQIIKSMKAALLLLKNSPDERNAETLKMIYASKLSLSYHKNLRLIKVIVSFLQRIKEYKLDSEERKIVTKLTAGLFAYGDLEIQCAMYEECHSTVVSILGVEFTRDKRSWEILGFLFEPTIVTEIICHGVTHENKKIRNMAEEMLLYILKGKIQIGETGWMKILESILPVLPLLQCFSNTDSSLGQCVLKMLDPDVSNDIQLPYIEVLKGNLRLLFASDPEVREEAVCRLIWLLGKENGSMQKLPKLSSLHGLPLNSLCIFERIVPFKRPDGSYQRSSLFSVLEMLKTSNVEPKIRKSALIQVSVMMTDVSLHKLFVAENGLQIILEIFSSALVEKDYYNYPDSVIPILTILRLICASESSIRRELSTRIDLYFNILRSLFLFPNNESVKIDASQLLCLLIYNEFIIRLGEKYIDKNNPLNISLPHLIAKQMKLPFLCKNHWKSSVHRRSDVAVLHGSNNLAISFVRIFWAWEYNGGRKILWKSWEDVNDRDIAEKLMIREFEFTSLQFSCAFFQSQQQLRNIQNSTTHDGVSSALDYLTMYMRLYHMMTYENLEDISELSWGQSFERFLLSHPSSREDCELFVNVLNFLYVYVNQIKNGKTGWLCKIMKNMTKSLSDLLRSLDTANQDVHQSVLRLARSCSASEEYAIEEDESQDSWINFIELVVSNLCFGDQQHFYNLAYLDWLLTCLTYLIGKCQWHGHKKVLINLGNALIELIISFHGAGTVSFMGLSITRNSIICLNHLLHQMQINLTKSSWTTFWYEEGRSLSWLPMLWKNRDPLVRASAFQLLAGLISGMHTASQLLNAVVLAPSELCHSLIYCITNQKECCIVKEEACIALSNLIKNCNTSAYQYVDSLKPNAIIIYIEQSNFYYEISALCSNCYVRSSLDPESLNFEENENEISKTQSAETSSISLVPRAISYLYNCPEDLQILSLKDSEIMEEENYPHFVATPSLISSLCNLLNSLIIVGEHEVIQQIYEHSMDKYLFSCFKEIPQNIECKKSLENYCDILEMYTSLCTVLTNCITHSNEFASVVSYSPDSIYLLLSFLDKKLYYTVSPRLIYLRNRFWIEVYNFLAVLSLTENQHLETIQTALELYNPEIIINSIYEAMKNSASELQMSAIGCLAFLLSQELQKDIKKGSFSLKDVLDTSNTSLAIKNNDNYTMQQVLSNVNKLSIRNSNLHGRKSNEEEKIPIGNNKTMTIGSEICKILLHLFIAHSYAKTKKADKQSRDKDLIVGALTNLLCVSDEAKNVAIEENLLETSLMMLKELYVKLNLQPFELYRSQTDREKKVHPLLHEVNAIFVLLMNFMYKSIQVKEIFAKAGLADVLHKLWAWIALHKSVLISGLKLIATFTTDCPEAAQSLPLTTTLPGTGLRKTPNTVALIHVIIHLVCKEIEKAGQLFENEKLHFAFHALRNSVHNHECRVAISKSNLLQFFMKIHPASTKRVKPWPLVEIYCLEFLIDFTYYEEGQLSVSKAVDGLDVLIQLARCSTPSTRILSLSTLRNVAFNVTNRPRLLTSVDFINLLHTTFKTGSTAEIGVVGSMLWSLISNNQKGKLIARSTGFAQSIQEVLGKLTLITVPEENQEKDLIKMLQYIIQILSPGENKNDPS
ncbi:rotatin [Leptopilina heterotoma]|uniref:rotatin n=1 Tax=Leptopilina heterotoma TaxID=63436 RepID=UPI001CA7EE60|nr:rotatin [Leptopilina heterotoma]